MEVMADTSPTAANGIGFYAATACVHSQVTIELKFKGLLQYVQRRCGC